MVTRLKVEKAQLEASLREEEAKSGLLLKEVKESNEVRVVRSQARHITSAQTMPLPMSEILVIIKPLAFSRPIPIPIPLRVDQNRYHDTTIPARIISCFDTLCFFLSSNILSLRSRLFLRMDRYRYQRNRYRDTGTRK